MTPRLFLTVTIKGGPTATLRIAGDRHTMTRSDSLRTITGSQAQAWKALGEFVNEFQKTTEETKNQ